MHGDFFDFGNGIRGFVDGIPDACEHEWDGDAILTFWDSDLVMKEKEYWALSDEERDKLKVRSGQSTCSKCGCAFLDANNPFMMEDPFLTDEE